MIVRAFCLLLLLAPVTASAQENDLWTFKRYTGKVGDQIKVSHINKQIDKTVTDFLGKLIPKEETLEQVRIYNTEILAVDQDGKPTKLKRHFTKAEEKKFGVEKKLPLDGKTVMIEKAGDKFTFTIVGEGPVPGKLQSEFLGEFNYTPSVNDFDLFFPDQPVKIGGTWDVKSTFLNSNEPFQFEREKAMGSAKLVKAYAKDGKKIGAVELHTSAPISGIKGYPAGTLKAGCAMQLDIKGEGCIDGSSPERSTTSVRKTFINFGNVQLDILATTTSRVEFTPKR